MQEDGSALTGIKFSKTSRANWTRGIVVAMRCVQPNGLRDETPVALWSIAGLAQDIIAHPDRYEGGWHKAGQLELARKVIRFLGDDAPPAIDTDPSMASAPLGGTATVTVSVYPPGADQQFTAAVKDPTIAGVKPMTAGTAATLTMPTLAAPRLHADTPAETADVEAPFPG